MLKLRLLDARCHGSCEDAVQLCPYFQDSPMGDSFWQDCPSNWEDITGIYTATFSEGSDGFLSLKCGNSRYECKTLISDDMAGEAPHECTFNLSEDCKVEIRFLVYDPDQE
ncbi:MAG: hypothetical protein AAGA75_15335 [Cyanobacteria bacterium P01_E01_bin.6]